MKMLVLCSFTLINNKIILAHHETRTKLSSPQNKIYDFQKTWKETHCFKPLLEFFWIQWTFIGNVDRIVWLRAAFAIEAACPAHRRRGIYKLINVISLLDRVRMEFRKSFFSRHANANGKGANAIKPSRIVNSSHLSNFSCTNLVKSHWVSCTFMGMNQL
jgi:hypothetical protein